MKKPKHKIDRVLACKVGIQLFQTLAEMGYTVVPLPSEVKEENEETAVQEQPASAHVISYLKTQADGTKLPITESPETTLNALIHEFRHVNPSYKQFFARKGDRKVLEDMMKLYPIDILFKLLAVLPQSNALPYAPVVTTPREFHRLAPKLIAFIQKKQSEKASGFKVSI